MMSHPNARRRCITPLLVLPLLGMIPGPLISQEIDRSSGLREIRPGCYVYLHSDDSPGVSSTFNNGVIVTKEGVVVIDGQRTEALARQVRESISRVTSQPVRFLISPTFHTPFTGGNAVYSDVLRIGHENCRADFLNLLKDGPAEEKMKQIPQLTYRDRMTLYLGGKEIQILYLGRAHTRGDSIVFLPEDRIAYLGEIFYLDEFPYISEGYSADWLKTLEAAEALKADIFVPGHGFLPKDLKESRAWLQQQSQILRDVRYAVQEQVKRGASENEAVRAIDLPQYKRFKGYGRALEIAVRRIYREMTVGLP
jgi:glyoxylase-like metal-dependent hydrolase (beta-lactamase superfamily II)